MNDVRKMIYGTIIGFFMMLVVWLSIVYVSACGLTLTCHRATPSVERTPIPTLIPVQGSESAKPVSLPSSNGTPLPALSPEAEEYISANPDVARPSNPGGPGPALDLTGDADNGKQLFAANCEFCHGAEGVGGLPNPNTMDGTVPSLNPIDPTMKDPDPKVFAFNIDLFIEHGSIPEAKDGYPARSMPAWGDRGALTPQQIANLIAYLINLNK